MEYFKGIQGIKKYIFLEWDILRINTTKNRKERRSIFQHFTVNMEENLSSTLHRNREHT